MQADRWTAASAGIAFRWLGYDGNLEELRPQFAGDEEAAVVGVPGDAVEDGFRSGAVGSRQQAGEVDPAEDFARSRRDAGDAVGVPDIGVDLAVDVLDLVDVVDGFSAVLHCQAADFLEGCGIEEAQGGGAVAEDEGLAILGEAPAFPVKRKRAQQAEAEAVI